jgi:hypothetical protein
MTLQKNPARCVAAGDPPLGSGPRSRLNQSARGLRLAGRAPAGLAQPATVSPLAPDVGRATSGATDLNTLRAWRAGSPSRALVLHGFDGRQGVTLIEWRQGSKYEARYDAVASAALALASGQVAWRAAAAPATPRDLELRGVAKRRG